MSDKKRNEGEKIEVGNEIPNSDANLLAEYKILVDLLLQQHTRIKDYDRTFLTANTILLGIFAIIMKNDLTGVDVFTPLLCVLGVLISMTWIMVSKRIEIDTDLRLWQLRETESDMKRKSGIFITGHDFFFKKKNLTGTDGITLNYPKWWSIKRFRVKYASVSLSVLFILCYVFIITLNLIQKRIWF